MPDIETKPRAPRAPPPRSLRALAIPAIALLAAMAWYVVMRRAEAELFRREESETIELARKLMNGRRELDRKRLENDCALLAYDPRLGTMLKTGAEPLLIEEFAKSIGKLSGQGVAVLSMDGGLIGSSIRDLDASTLRSSSVVDRAQRMRPQDTEDVTNLARSGFWVMRGESLRVLEVAVSPIHLGEPIGMIALTASLGDLLREVHQLSGVSGAIFVGNELFVAEPPAMRETFTSFSDLPPGHLIHSSRNGRDLIALADELETSGLGIRVVFIDEAPPRGGLFGLLLWVPILGALLLGIREGLVHDRQKRR